jgi:hypothetical protein
MFVALDTRLNVGKLDVFMHEDVLKRIIHQFEYFCPRFAIDCFSVEQRVDVRFSILLIMHNLLQGNEHHIQALASAGLFQIFKTLLSIENKLTPALYRDMFECLSLVTAGQPGEIDILFHSGLVHEIIEWLRAERFGFAVQHFPLLTIANITMNGTREQIHELAEANVFPVFLDILDSRRDVQAICIALEALGMMFRAGASMHEEGHWLTNKYVDHVFSIGGHQRIEQMQDHRDKDVYERALALLETYFEIEQVQ